MNAFEMLLIPSGTMKRLNYALLSGLFSALNYGLVAFMAFNGQIEGSIWQAVSGDPFSLLAASPLMAGVLMTSLWIQVCLVFKRSRDLNGSTGLAWVFVASWLGPYALPVVYPGVTDQISMSSVYLLGGIAAAITGMMLLLTQGRAGDEVVGSKMPESGNSVDETPILGLLDDRTDLVARAAALREADAASLQNTPRASLKADSSPQNSRSFGKRGLIVAKLE